MSYKRIEANEHHEALFTESNLALKAVMQKYDGRITTIEQIAVIARALGYAIGAQPFFARAVLLSIANENIRMGIIGWDEEMKKATKQ